MSFDYLIEKINRAEITTEPFRHILIGNFFSPEHFSQIVATPEIAISNQANDEQLFETLFAKGWKVISFPGCITDPQTYIAWHKDKRGKVLNNSACEGFGITMRLVAPQSNILTELADFMATKPFLDALAARFHIAPSDVHYDGGIQKYLDGYEISPHPDIRRKALTYMVNINPAADSHQQNHHTHYLKFSDCYRYVQSYWEGNPDRERAWVPWDWCEGKKEQRENNSIVIFAPSNDTMHGVKASYDHLANQRTQLYGNLWYHPNPLLPQPDWEDLVIHPGAHKSKLVEQPSLASIFKGALPASVKQFIKHKVLGKHKTEEMIAARTISKSGY